MIDDTTGQSGHSLDGSDLVAGRIKRIGSRSGPNGACVEVSQDVNGDILVTNSNRQSDPPQRFTRKEWAVHLLACREGEHDEWVAEEIAMLLKQRPLAAVAV